MSISEFSKGYIMFSLKKCTVLVISLLVAFFLVSVILYKLWSTNIFDPQLFYGHANQVCHSCFYVFSAFTNHTASINFTAIAYTDLDKKLIQSILKCSKLKYQNLTHKFATISTL